MKTREQAEQKALKLYPPSYDALHDHIQLLNRQSYLQCWDDMQVASDAEQAADEVADNQLREAAEMVVKKSAWYDLEHISIDFANAVVELEKALK